MADPNAGLHRCPTCGALVWYENLPHCEPTTEKTKQAATPARTARASKKK